MANALKRYKEIILRYNAGEDFISIAKDYGMSRANAGVIYNNFKYIAERPFYDLVAEVDASTQAAVRLVNALARIEAMTGSDISADYIKSMDRNELVRQRYIGKSVMDAFDKMQEVLKNE